MQLPMPIAAEKPPPESSTSMRAPSYTLEGDLYAVVVSGIRS